MVLELSLFTASFIFSFFVSASFTVGFILGSYFEYVLSLRRI